MTPPESLRTPPPPQKKQIKLFGLSPYGLGDFGLSMAEPRAQRFFRGSFSDDDLMACMLKYENAGQLEVFLPVAFCVCHQEILGVASNMATCDAEPRAIQVSAAQIRMALHPETWGALGILRHMAALTWSTPRTLQLYPESSLGKFLAFSWSLAPSLLGSCQEVSDVVVVGGCHFAFYPVAAPNQQVIS